MAKLVCSSTRLGLGPTRSAELWPTTLFSINFIGTCKQTELKLELLVASCCRNAFGDYWIEVR